MQHTSNRIAPCEALTYDCHRYNKAGSYKVTYPLYETTGPYKHFDSVKEGTVIVLCDYANVRCYCDMNYFINVLPTATIISVGKEVTIFNNLPYRKYLDTEVQCHLMIAEHDGMYQIIKTVI